MPETSATSLKELYPYYLDYIRALRADVKKLWPKMKEEYLAQELTFENFCRMLNGMRPEEKESWRIRFLSGYETYAQEVKNLLSNALVGKTAKGETP